MMSINSLCDWSADSFKGFYGLFPVLPWIRTSTGSDSCSVCVSAVGLDAAGKTTLLYKLKLAEVVTTIPTIGEWF